MKSLRPHRYTQPRNDPGPTRWLASAQLAVGIVVSAATVYISWQTHRLTERTEDTNAKLKSIEQELAQSKFSFERTRDIYDRTEKYLSAPSKEQDEARGKVLVALIGSLPDAEIRSQLLGVVTETAKSKIVAVKAATIKTAVSTKPTVPYPPATSTQAGVPGFSGPQLISVNNETYTGTTLAPITFTDSKARLWEVPKGAQFSGETIPRAMWSLLGPPLTSSYTVPAVLHEYYYRQQNRPREDVDLMFFEALQAAGVDKAKANMVYQAVRMFGNSAWVAARNQAER